MKSRGRTATEGEESIFSTPSAPANITPKMGRKSSNVMIEDHFNNADKLSQSAWGYKGVEMWIQSLISTNDWLREELGLPKHVKSTRKIVHLMNSSHPLAISDINAMVLYAQEQTEENASLQRLLESGGVHDTYDVDEGLHKLKRPRSSPSKSSKSPHRKKVSC